MGGCGCWASASVRTVENTARLRKALPNRIRPTRLYPRPAKTKLSCPSFRNHGREGFQGVKGRGQRVNFIEGMLGGLAGFLEPATSAYASQNAIRLPNLEFRLSH